VEGLQAQQQHQQQQQYARNDIVLQVSRINHLTPFAAVLHCNQDTNTLCCHELCAKQTVITTSAAITHLHPVPANPAG
jgi:hypothetical protein